jgi:gliding motility-associated-like protein
MTSAMPASPLNQPPVLYPTRPDPCYFYRIQLGAFGPSIPDSTRVTVRYSPNGPSTDYWHTNSLPGTTWFSGEIPAQWANRPTEICFELEVPGGCRDSLCFPLRFAPEVSLPNVFTPNSDGVNDGFLPNFENVDWAHWEIYSRWGQKVYESASYTEPWDGRIGSSEAADGVYFIVVRAGNSDVPGEVVTRGSLHLMR